MALFPAYSGASNNAAENGSTWEKDTSYAWLKDLDVCVEEDEQPKLEECHRDDSEAIQSSQTIKTETQPKSKSQPSPESPQRKKKKKEKKMKKRKKKKKKAKQDSGKKHDSLEDENKNHTKSDYDSTSEHSTSGSTNVGKTKKTPKSKKKSKAKVKRKRSRSNSPTQKKSVKCESISTSEPRKGNTSTKSISERRKEHSKSRSRSGSSDSSIVCIAYKFKSRSPSPSRWQSKRKFIRSRSRTKKRYSRSSSRSRKGYTRRSRSRDRWSKKYTRSRSRSKDRRGGWESKSKERYRRSRSRSLKGYGRSRTMKKHAQSRSRSKSRFKKRSRSRSRSRENVRHSPSSGPLVGKVQEYVAKSKTVFLEGLQGLVKPEQAFYLATDGDTNNLAFITTHYSVLASYKVIAKGELGNEKPSNFSRKDKLRYFKKPALKVLYSDAMKLRSLPKNISKSQEHNKNEYVPLTLTFSEEATMKQTLHQTDINPLGIYDSSTELYLQGIGDTTQEEGAQSSSDIELDYWQRKSREYNERLGKEPTNVPLWLEFVKFQDEAFYILFQDCDSENIEVKKKSKKNLKALAERKISILDSAIKKNVRSLKLNFERLEIGQDIWDDKKLRQEWDTLIFNFPNNMSIWHHYLAFTQTHFTSFNLADAVRTFSRCTERLVQIQSGAFLTHAPPSHLGRCLVDIAAQLARMWRQCGHMERAVALFQALVELNLFSPPRLRKTKMSLEAKLALFEPFWDSRAPRFGEEKSLGWAEVMARKETVVYPEVILEGTHDEEDEVLDKGGSTSQMWLALETSRERRHWIPWEQDPEDCEDPERMVPLDDLSNHLFVLDSEDDCFYLILQFLRFLEVPEVDKFIVEDHSNVTKIAGEKAIFDPLVTETLYDVSLFGNKLTFNTEEQKHEILNFDRVGPSLVKPKCDDYCQFLCRVIYQASNVFSRNFKEKLTIMYIKLLGAQYQSKMLESNDKTALKKEIKKKIKNVLKLEEFRMCLPIYEEYGRVEELMGHLDDAANVYTTALTVGTTSGNALDISNNNLSAVLELLDSYIKLQIKRELETFNGEHIHNLLYSLCSLIISEKFVASKGSSAPGGLMLKAKRKLIELQELHQGFLTVNYNSDDDSYNKKMLVIRSVSFLALIQLFTVGFKPACLIYETIIEKIEQTDINPLPHKLDDIALPDINPLPIKLDEIALPSENPTKIAHDTPNKCEKCERKSEVCKGRCGVMEQLYEGYLWLVEVGKQMKHIVNDGCMSPVQHRTLLSAATTVAPYNHTFLLLTAQNQGWKNLVGLVDGIVEGKAHITMLVSRLLPHLQRTLTLLTATQEGTLSCGSRLESVLESAVVSSAGKHCPLLWRLYMALISVTKPKKLKDLGYRAIAHCPAVKSVYLDCIRRVPWMLKELVTLMTEKGMRVRLPLEELQVLTEAELEFEEAENQMENDEEGRKEEEEETWKKNSLLDIPIPD